MYFWISLLLDSDNHPSHTLDFCLYAGELQATSSNTRWIRRVLSSMQVINSAIVASQLFTKCHYYGIFCFMTNFDGPEQLQLDGMERFQIPESWLPTVTVEITDQPRFRDYRVSPVGQFTLPASARERWGLRDGGTVNVFDVGGAVFIFPEQIDPDTARELIHQAFRPVEEPLPPKSVTRVIPMSGILDQIVSEYE